jgi:hypothetical protein
VIIGRTQNRARKEQKEWKPFSWRCTLFNYCKNISEREELFKRVVLFIEETPILLRPTIENVKKKQHRKSLFVFHL